MKNWLLSKKNRIILIVVFIVVLITIIVFVNYFIEKNRLTGIYLDAQVTAESDIIDYKNDLLILHLNSEVKLSYNTIPNKKIDIKFNDYDKDIIKIDSLGNLKAIKTGKTKIRIQSGNVVSNTINVYVY